MVKGIFRACLRSNTLAGSCPGNLLEHDWPRGIGVKTMAAPAHHQLTTVASAGAAIDEFQVAKGAVNPSDGKEPISLSGHYYDGLRSSEPEHVSRLGVTQQAGHVIVGAMSDGH